MTNDLIDRQAAIDKAIEIPVARIVTEDKVIWRKAVFVEDIEALPPVDAVPVVRCKDCTYSRPFSAVVIQCTRYADSRLKTDYCSYGKRKDGDNHEG